MNKYKKIAVNISSFHIEENKERYKLEKEKLDLKQKGQKAKGLKERVDFTNRNGINRQTITTNTLSKLCETQTADTIKPLNPSVFSSNKPQKMIEIEI